LKKVFDARTEGKIPPICIILEEAHNFAPSIGSQENSISTSIIKNIAREGRKFGVSLCVTSQRPSMIDTTLLSQCGTIIALRTVNDNDIKSISSIAEGIDVNILKRLPPGVALIAGRGVNYPVYTKIKRRIVQEEKDKITLKNEKLLSIKGSGQAKFFGD
jgi:DNA helicase HerA-like ATPase